MVVDRHGFAVFLERPGERHHDLEAGQRNARLVLAAIVVWRPRCQNVEQITADNVRFREAPGDVHAVRLLVVEADPFLEIAQHLEGVVAEFVAVVIVDAVTTELK
jgi:hypothetical protein